MNVLAGIDDAERERALGFAGRVALADPKAPVRLVAADGVVAMWARTSFGVWITLDLRGMLDRPGATVYATDLVTALAIARGDEVDIGAGPDEPWQGRMPPAAGWLPAGTIAPAELEMRVLAAARAAAAASDAELTALDGASKKASAPLDLLDRTALTIGQDDAIEVPVRVLLALSALGFAAARENPAAGVPVRATATWLRIDTAAGSALRHGIGLSAAR